MTHVNSHLLPFNRHGQETDAMNMSTTHQPTNANVSRVHPTAIAAMAIATLAAVILLLSAVSALNTSQSAGQATPIPGQVDICSTNRQGMWFPIQVEQEFKAHCEEQAAP
jgi:hypothetical protein